jgi:hypothetical protein
VSRARAAQKVARTAHLTDQRSTRSVAWCCASIWSAPDGSGLLTLEASSVQTDGEGSRRIVWMIKQARRPHMPEPCPLGGAEHGADGHGGDTVGHRGGVQDPGLGAWGTPDGERLAAQELPRLGGQVGRRGVEGVGHDRRRPGVHSGAAGQQRDRHRQWMQAPTTRSRRSRRLGVGWSTAAGCGRPTTCASTYSSQSPDGRLWERHWDGQLAWVDTGRDVAY